MYFPTPHLRLGLPSIFKSCNLLCVGFNVHILGKISYVIRQLQGMCSCCIVRRLKGQVQG